MARTIKPEEFASKRSQILDAAQKLVFTKGYEQMSIRDILDEIQISSGAFHHYFDSREALLEAFIDRIKQGSEKPLLTLLQNPQLSAIEKLQGFFDTLDSLRMARKAELVALGNVWYTDDNAIVREKVNLAVLQQRAPLINEIVRQGIREGAFTTPYPEQAGEVLLILLQGMGNTHARLLLSINLPGNGPIGSEKEHYQETIIARIVTTHAAYLEAIERVLGAPPNSLVRTDAEAVKVWIVAG